MKKNIPILKKKICELITDLKMTPVEALQALEPLCEALRKQSRQMVEKDVDDFLKKFKLPKIKTDY